VLGISLSIAGEPALASRLSDSLDEARESYGVVCTSCFATPPQRDGTVGDPARGDVGRARLRRAEDAAAARRSRRGSHHPHKLRCANCAIAPKHRRSLRLATFNMMTGSAGGVLGDQVAPLDHAWPSLKTALGAGNPRDCGGAGRDGSACAARKREAAATGTRP